MFAYYFDLALRSFRRNRVLTALMVLAIALGIGASMTTLTVFHVLSGDPIPQKSSKLFTVQLDPQSMDGYTPGEEPEDQVTRYDAEHLLREAKGDRQALMTGGGVAVQPDRQGLAPFALASRYTPADVFPMIEPPFLAGSGWSKAQDDAHDRVVVITRKLAEKLYGTVQAVGKTLRMDGNDFRVVGVMEDFRPKPKFYDLNSDRYGEAEQIYLPFSTSRDLKMGRNGSMNCWDDGKEGEDDPEGETGVNAPCTWMQYWVQLDTPEKAAAYKRYLTNQLRSTFMLKVPVRLFFRERPGKAKRKFRVDAIKGHKQTARRRR